MNNDHWKQTVLKRFDRAASDYGAHNAVQQQAAKTLLSLTNNNQPYNNILEIGCGDGTLTCLLIQKFPHASITATDISPAMLETAQKNIPPTANMKMMNMDGENLTTTDRYDLIISNMTAQWFKDKDAALAHWQKHLQPTGEIVLSRPGPDNFQQWQQALTDLGLQSGLLPNSPSAHIVKQDTIHTAYSSTLNFLRSMRRAGVTTPRAGYTPLTPAQLKQACALCDQHSNGTITWHILYERYTNA